MKPPNSSHLPPPRTSVSFEFFPPHTQEMEATLWAAIERLAPIGPSFVSVTYGAGGSTRERTHATLERLMSETTLRAAAHLTCVDASRADVDQVVERYRDAGVRHIVALRGDTPQQAHPTLQPQSATGYRDALALIEGIRRIDPDMELSVAAYPEVHPRAASARADLDWLKRKIDAGATRAITQFFFEADTFLRFLDRAAAAGITIPIVPGILPVTNFATVERFAQSCGARVPPWLAETFGGLDDDPKTRQLVAASTAIDLCRALQRSGVNDFHFYTLNRAELTRSICHMLGVRASTGRAAPESSDVAVAR
ncbi:MAG: methylenetetrahydrofolate reductase [NAD(P)H] [Pseudomonadota bacterium]